MTETSNIAERPFIPLTDLAFCVGFDDRYYEVLLHAAQTKKHCGNRYAATLLKSLETAFYDWMEHDSRLRYARQLGAKDKEREAYTECEAAFRRAKTHMEGLQAILTV